MVLARAMRNVVERVRSAMVEGVNETKPHRVGYLVHPGVLEIARIAIQPVCAPMLHHQHVVTAVQQMHNVLVAVLFATLQVEDDVSVARRHAVELA